MPTVYLRDSVDPTTRFHRDPSCYQLRKKPPRGTSPTLLAVPLETLNGPSPCRICYPDAPHLKIYKRYCYECETHLACPHNGGIPVIVRNVVHTPSLFMGVGEEWDSVRWVWPDRVRARATR
jgi:hypothetical protein